MPHPEKLKNGLLLETSSAPLNASLMKKPAKMVSQKNGPEIKADDASDGQ